VNKSILKLFAVALLVTPLTTVTLQAQDESDRPDEPARQEESKQEEKKSKPSIMELLRERITGSLGAAIEILSRGPMETSGDWVTIREDAQVSYKDTKILADRIRFNQASYELEASGNVVLLTKGARIGGESMLFNLREQTGSITKPLVETEDGFILAGETLQKYGPNRYRIEHARLTSCTQPTPYWLLRASLIDFQVGKAATLRHTRFNLGKVPVFYTPWLRLPMNNERASGFLMPIWGTSDFHGFYINTSYFWAINRSHDATVGFDYYEKRGYRYSGEYRNDLGNNNFTNAYFFYIDDDTVGHSRYDARIRSRQSLPWNTAASVDIQLLSDREYRRDFINRNIWYSPLFRRSASLTKNFSVYTLSAAYNDISRFEGNNKIRSIRYEPSIDFRGRERRIFSLPVYYSFQANYAHPSIVQLKRKNTKESFTEGKRDTYHRLDLLGTLKAPITTFSPWLIPHLRQPGKGRNPLQAYCRAPPDVPLALRYREAIADNSHRPDR